MKTCNVCSREQLQQLLDESLPEPIEVDISEHIARCSTCQQELETLAGVKEWWNEVSDRLSESSIELPMPGGHLADGHQLDRHPQVDDLAVKNGSFRTTRNPSPAIGSSIQFDDDAYITDFAVDFLDPSDDVSMLGRLGEYEIVEVIGRGGMGIVLKGYQKELQRFVAVKVLSPHLATSRAARRRFAREAQATAAVVNPHVMAIHSVNASSKLPYLVMPFTACESLQDRLDRGGPLELRDILRIGMQAALGLAAAHAQGLVHRDIKPANILLETNVDRVMLTDFGLARAVDDATLTRTGIIVGTPQYMSPEQANGDPVGHSSDLFSLGSVVYAMCTARPPFRAESTFGVLRRIRETEPRSVVEINNEIPRWFERIVMRLMEKQPQDRPANAVDVADLLEKCLAHVQQPTIVRLPPGVDCSKDSVQVSVPMARASGLLIASLVVVITLVGVSRLMTRPMLNSGQTTHKSVERPAFGASRGEAKPTDDELFGWKGTEPDGFRIRRSLHQLESSVDADLRLIEADSNPGELEELNPKDAFGE